MEPSVDREAAAAARRDAPDPHRAVQDRDDRAAGRDVGRARLDAGAGRPLCGEVAPLRERGARDRGPQVAAVRRRQSAADPAVGAARPEHPPGDRAPADLQQRVPRPRARGRDPPAGRRHRSDPDPRRRDPPAAGQDPGLAVAAVGPGRQHDLVRRVARLAVQPAGRIPRGRALAPSPARPADRALGRHRRARQGDRGGGRRSRPRARAADVRGAARPAGGDAGAAAGPRQPLADAGRGRGAARVQRVLSVGPAGASAADAPRAPRGRLAHEVAQARSRRGADRDAAVGPGPGRRGRPRGGRQHLGLRGAHRGRPRPADRGGHQQARGRPDAGGGGAARHRGLDVDRDPHRGRLRA